MALVRPLHRQLVVFALLTWGCLVCLLLKEIIHQSIAQQATSSLEEALLRPPSSSRSNNKAPITSLPALQSLVERKCKDAKTKEEVTKFVGDVYRENILLPSPTTTTSHAASPSFLPCKHVLLDFGANIGDTAALMMLSGWSGCQKRMDDQLQQLWPKLNVKERSIELLSERRRPPMAYHLEKTILEFDVNLTAEDYCYYGVEGNPAFTQHLQELQHFLANIRPKSLAHVQFLTESVGAGQDGTTKFYLDTVNHKANYWGSSLFADHQDVRKSKKKTDSVSEINVMGYTIPTLLRKTIEAYNTTTTTSSSSSHLILKIDIEGGEDQLLYQAVQEGSLCEFARNNRVDIFVEFHSQRVTGPNPLASKRKEYKTKLEECGVAFHNLDATWA